MDPEVVPEFLVDPDPHLIIIDPDVIIISDEELENSSNENESPIIISDDEISSEMYDFSTPEASLPSGDEDSNHQPENISSEVEYVYTFNTNALKRKPDLEAEELNIEQKKIKTETETEVQNITTVHDMIVQCKKMLPSHSENTSLVEEEECSEDVNNESSQEISSDGDSIINENTSNDVTGNSDKEKKTGEASDGTNEENYSDSIDSQLLKDILSNESKTEAEMYREIKQVDKLYGKNIPTKDENSVVLIDIVNANESKIDNDFIDGNDVPINEIKTDDGTKQLNNLNDANNIAINEKDQNNQSNVSKDKYDFIEENKNEKSTGNLKRNKYSSKESLFNTTTDPVEEITTDI